MKEKIMVGLHNYFKFVRRNAKTGKVLGEYKAENIILNNFWNVYLSNNNENCLNYIHFGSGTAQPVASDVKLTTWLGYKASVAMDTDFSNYEQNKVVKVRRTCRLQDTEYVGQNISEVGFSNNTSGTTGLLTKALVKDMNGNVVSIPKLEGEVLDIFATFFIDFSVLNSDTFRLPVTSLSNDTGYFLFRCLSFSRALNTSKTSAQCTWTYARPQLDLTLMTYSGQGPETGYYNGGYPVISFDVPSKKLIITPANVVVANGNLEGGIRGGHWYGLNVILPNAGFPQPIIEKEVVGVGDGVTKDFQTAFGYVRNNGTAKIFVNDIEVSGVIDFDKFYPRTNIISDMIVLSRKGLSDDGYSMVTNAVPGLSGGNVSEETEVILENPWYATVPIESVHIARSTMYASDDMQTWVQVATNTSQSAATRSIDSAYRNCRYFKHVATSTNTPYVTQMNSSVAVNEKNIHLSTAPAQGDTVAVTYQPDCLAKNDQCVMNNISVEISFNEYSPE